MKLQECIKIAKECGLINLKEAYNNIDFHSVNFFIYENIAKEMNELANEIEEKYNLHSLSNEEFFKTIEGIKI